MFRKKTFYTTSFSTRTKRFPTDLYEIKSSFVMAKMIVLVKKAKLISTHVIKMAGIIRQPAYLKLQTETYCCPLFWTWKFSFKTGPQTFFNCRAYSLTWPASMLIHKNTRTLLQRLSLSCLEIRSSNEKAINSTRNRIYSLKVFHFLLYRRRVFFRMFTFYLFLNWLSTRVSEDQKYVCGRRLYARINTKKFKGLDSWEITSLPEIKKVIYMACHFNHRRK